MNINLTDINKIRKYIYRRFVLTFAAIMILLSLSGSIAAAFSDVYKNRDGRVEINLESGMIHDAEDTINVAGIKALTDAFPDAEISYINESDFSLKSGFSLVSVKVVYTGSSYMDFLKIRMVKGSYFTENACKGGRKVAIISTDLAGKMFSTHNALGNYINLQNEKYKVIGVYEQDTSIISLLGSDGGERVYVPFGSGARAQFKQIKTILLSDKTLEKDKFRVHKVEQVLSEGLKVFPKDKYRINDYYEPSMASQFQPLFIFFIGLWCMMMLMGHYVKFIKANYMRFKRGLTGNYLLEVIKEEWLELLKIALVSTCFAVCSGGIFMIIRFNLYIPPELVPQDNIFDFEFYGNKVKEAVHRINSSYGYVPTVFERDYRVVRILEMALGVCLIPAFIGVLSLVKAIGLMGIGGVREFMRYLFAASILFVGSFTIIILVAGTQFVFLPKCWIVSVLFVVLYTGWYLAGNIDYLFGIRKGPMPLAYESDVTGGYKCI